MYLDTSAAISKLLGDDTAVEGPEPQAPVLRGDVGVYKPQLPSLSYDLVRVFPRHVMLGRIRDDLICGELPGQLLILLLLIGQFWKCTRKESQRREPKQVRSLIGV